MVWLTGWSQVVKRNDQSGIRADVQIYVNSLAAALLEKSYVCWTINFCDFSSQVQILNKKSSLIIYEFIKNHFIEFAL